MTKHLILMRHAKSDWSNSGLHDKERPLNKRGERAAPHMAHWLSEHQLRPQVIVCSSAVRTRQTLDRMLSFWEAESSDEESPLVRYTDKLYLASPATILGCAQVACSKDTISRVLVIGHNPGMELLASELSGGEIAMPTAALVVLREGKDTWPDAWDDPMSWKLENFVAPKQLAEDLD